jgi:SAM-dependent methyltransferase
VERSKAYRYNRFYQRWVGEQNYIRAIPATEQRRTERQAFLDKNKPKDTSRLQLNPELEMPSWYDGVEWHLEPGGWDGYDLTQPMFMAGIGPFVFALGGYAASQSTSTGNIRAQRAEVVKQSCRQARSQNAFTQPGSCGATTLGVCRPTVPDAELIGGDLSPALLRGGHFMSEMLGLNITFRQEDCTKVAERDNSVDGVISYALHHEMPPAVTEKTLREMFRILTPGGEMVINDPPPFRAVDPLQAVVLDWDTDESRRTLFQRGREHQSRQDDARDRFRRSRRICARKAWLSLGHARSQAGLRNDHVTHRRTTRAPYLGQMELDDVMRMNTELLAELWILRDRVTVLEHMLEEKQIIDRKALADFVPQGELAQGNLERERNALVTRVAGAPHAETYDFETLAKQADVGLIDFDPINVKVRMGPALIPCAQPTVERPAIVDTASGAGDAQVLYARRRFHAEPRHERIERRVRKFAGRPLARVLRCADHSALHERLAIVSAKRTGLAAPALRSRASPASERTNLRRARRARAPVARRRISPRRSIPGGNGCPGSMRLPTKRSFCA